MIGTAIELHFDCGRCENPVHVNAMVSQVPCSQCDHVTTLEWSQWQSLLEDSFEEIPDYERGRGGRTQTLAAAGPNTDLLYARFVPYCFECKTDFDADALTNARVDDVACSNCDAHWHARAPSPEIERHFPQIRYLFAEDPKLIPDAFGHRPEAKTSTPGGAKPVVFACPACGGGLKVDGSDRMVPCSHCDSSVYLPDDLWRRLHPVSTKRRWFIWWDEGGRRRDPARFPTDEHPVEEESFERDVFDSVEDESPTLVSAPRPARATPEPLPPVGVVEAAEVVTARGHQGRNAALVMVAMAVVLILAAAGVAFYVISVQADALQDPSSTAGDEHPE